MNSINFAKNPPTPYCIGFDLHSNNIVTCVVQTQSTDKGLIGKVVYRSQHKIVGQEAIDAFLNDIKPYCEHSNSAAVVESTYNWYWLADAFEKRSWNLRIADPCTVSKANLKHSDDFTDAQYLAEQVRIVSIRTTSIMPKDERALRDACRLRQSLVQERACAKITIVNMFTNHLSERISVSSLLLRAKELKEKDLPITNEIVQDYFDNEWVRIRVVHLLKKILYLNEEIEMIDKKLRAALKNNYYTNALKQIKGCGEVLASAIVVEIGDLNRFSSHKNFVSYCRLAPTAKLSNGKSKGNSNAKNGNAYLSWAMTELANLAVRFNPEVKRFYDRTFNRTRLRVIAIRIVAAKLARAIYMMLKHGEAFDVSRCFGS